MAISLSVPGWRTLRLVIYPQRIVATLRS